MNLFDSGFTDHRYFPLSTIFKSNTLVKTFDELQRFTKIKTMSSVTNASNFAYCTSLVALSIPSSVTSFVRPTQYCSSLRRILFYPATPPASNSTNLFGTNVPNTIKIYVPDDYIETYKETWTSWTSKIYPLSDLSEQGN